LDELVASWYRHRGQCHIEGCDCPQNDLAEQASIICNHLCFIKNRFRETLIDAYPYFNRFVREGLEPDEYETLTSHKTSRAANTRGAGRPAVAAGVLWPPATTGKKT
jgi:hypothetical protein